MPLTPQITLTVNLLDYSGAQIGSAEKPAYVRIGLANFGGFLPCIPGTGVMGKVASWSQDIEYLGTELTIALWGNDVITPGGTYYVISVLDPKRNVIQAAAYQFSGTATLDLSNLAPYLPPSTPLYTPNAVVTNPTGLQTIDGDITIDGNLIVTGTITPSGGGLFQYVTTSFSATPTFTNPGGNVIFDLTLTGNVTGSSLAGMNAGDVVEFFITQDATGGRSFVWPTAVKGAGVVDGTANAVNSQMFVMRTDNNLYPTGPMTVYY
jgi:hypothetical protein